MTHSAFNIMLLLKIVFFFALNFVARASINSTKQHSSILDPNIQNLNDSIIISAPLATPPRPNETIGEYFDKLLSLNHSTLEGRHLRRTNRLTEATWSDGKTNFNISMSRCLSLSDMAGIYTSKYGVRYNATIQDIVNDLQVRGGSEAANRIKYASSVLENAQVATNTANAYLTSMKLDYAPTIGYPHDELRHLLAPIGQYVALIARTKLIFEISVGFRMHLTGKLATNTTTPEAVAAAIVTSGLFFAHECTSLARGGRGLNFFEATIFNAFLAWLRELVTKFPHDTLYGPNSPGNRTEETIQNRVRWPISQTALKNAIKKLQNISEPSLHFASQKELEAGSSCSDT